VELEDLHATFVVRVPKVDLFHQLQVVLNCTELLGVHFDAVVCVLHDQQILLDDDFAYLCKYFDFLNLHAVHTVHFGIERIPILPRLLIDDDGYFIDLHIDVAIEIIELYVLRSRRDFVLAQTDQGGYFPKG